MKYDFTVLSIDGTTATVLLDTGQVQSKFEVEIPLDTKENVATAIKNLVDSLNPSKPLPSKEVQDMVDAPLNAEKLLTKNGKPAEGKDKATK